MELRFASDPENREADIFAGSWELIWGEIVRYIGLIRSNVKSKFPTTFDGFIA